MYRDHQKGLGGPPGGATYPGGPHGLKGTIPWWAGAPPLGLPLRLGLETLGVGGKPPPWPPPPLEIGSPRAGAPPGAIYKEGRREGSRIQAPGASLSLP